METLAPDSPLQGEPNPVALVLKGGGVKGLAFAGALRVLEPHYSFQAFVGTSAGAITAVLLAAGYNAEELEAALRQKSFGDFVSERWPGCLWRFLTQKGWYSGDPIQEWIQDLLQRKIPREAGVTMGDLPRRAILYASKRPRGTLVFDSNGRNRDVSADFAARCSMSIPFLFRPHTVEGSRVFDGGVLHNFPLTEYRRENPAGKVLGLYLSTGPHSGVENPGIVGELFDLILDRGEKAAVDEFREHIVVIDPSPIRTAQFSLTETAKEFLLQQGRAAALRFLADRKLADISPGQAMAAEAEALRLHGRVVDEERVRRRRRRVKAWCWLLGIIAAVFVWFALGQEIDGSLRRADSEIADDVNSFGRGQWPHPPPPVVKPPPARQAWTEQEMRVSIGSLFLVSFEDWGVAAQLIKEDGVSGFFLLKRNVEDKGSEAQSQELLAERIDQVQSLVRNHSWPQADSRPVPLIIAADQEGGTTQVLPSSIVTEIPAPMALGGLRRIDDVDRAARIVSSELKAIGVNVNLAPIADVNKRDDNSLIRDRSFGGDGNLVGEMALAWYETAKCEGVVSVAKHFPGHGATEEGIEGPAVPVSRINRSSLPEAIAPFRSLVNAGIPAVMTSHLNPFNVSQGEVVTFDKRMVELLRGKDKRFSADGLSFQGTLLSDDLNMPCITAPVPEDDREKYQDRLFEAVRRAFVAGHDLLLVGNVFPDGTSDKTMTSSFANLPKGITLSEFRRLLARFSAFIFDAPPEKRDMLLRRLEQALQSVHQLRSGLEWGEPAKERIPRLRKLREKHGREAEEIFRKSFAFLPSGSSCPNFHPLAKTPSLVVFPTRNEPYPDLRGLNKERREKMLELERQNNDIAWYLRDKLPESHEEMMAGRLPSDEEVRRYAASLGKDSGISHEEKRALRDQLSREEDREHAVRIAAMVREERPPLIIFVVTLKRHVDLLGYFLLEASKINGFNFASVAVIVTPHPNQLARLKIEGGVDDLASQVAYFFAYTTSRSQPAARQRSALLFVDELFKLDPGKCPENWPVPPVPISPVGFDDVSFRVIPRSGKLTCGRASQRPTG